MQLMIKKLLITSWLMKIRMKLKKDLIKMMKNKEDRNYQNYLKVIRKLRKNHKLIIPQ